MLRSRNRWGSVLSSGKDAREGEKEMATSVKRTSEIGKKIVAAVKAASGCTTVTTLEAHLRQGGYTAHAFNKSGRPGGTPGLWVVDRDGNAVGVVERPTNVLDPFEPGITPDESQYRYGAWSIQYEENKAAMFERARTTKAAPQE